jgi:hypothetical protein
MNSKTREILFYFQPFIDMFKAFDANHWLKVEGKDVDKQIDFKLIAKREKHKKTCNLPIF